MLRWLLASFHLLALAIGLSAVWVRYQALRLAPDLNSVRRALHADTVWGIAALLWLGTGLPRLFMGTEKATTYYVHNHLFWLKMGLFVVVVLMESTPAIALTKWRIALKKGQTPDTSLAPRWAMISRIEAGLVLLMLFVATAMARGYGSQ